jgi:hypothetical protein
MNKGLTILVFKSLLTSIIIFGYLNTLFAQTPSDSLKLIWIDVNKSDWEILNILLKNPEISNKAISDLAFLSIDGIGSSLRRMYVYFDINETNYKKVVLIKKAIEISNSN